MEIRQAMSNTTEYESVQPTLVHMVRLKLVYVFFTRQNTCIKLSQYVIWLAHSLTLSPI